MKKRLLITSIVMMLVVAVSLGTATYAWFTSNATVVTSSMTLRAEVNGASSLGIGWLGGEASTSIDTLNVDLTLFPMAPETLIDSTTTSAVVFKSATIKEENSVKVFNGDVADSSEYTLVSSLADSETSAYYVKSGDNRLAKEGVKYYETNTSLFPKTGIEANTTNVGSYYIRKISPVIYNNGTQSAFYVKNLSNTNDIGRITVTAVFSDTIAYVLTSDTTFKNGKTYYTSSGESTFNPATVTAGDSVTPATYYELRSANDMIRVAIFTKPASNGTSGEANYTLLGVLGQTASTPTQLTTGASFDKNTTYYVKDGDNYVQTAIADADAFAPYVTSENANYGKLYTIANTAAYTYNAAGATADAQNMIQVNDAVKDLGHYTNVKTSLVLTDTLEASKQIDIVAIAWLDGTELTDARAGDLGQVSLKFEA